jgi:hypothetical protein
MSIGINTHSGLHNAQRNMSINNTDQTASARRERLESFRNNNPVERNPGNSLELMNNTSARRERLESIRNNNPVETSPGIPIETFMTQNLVRNEPPKPPTYEHLIRWVEPQPSGEDRYKYRT